jgi:hypothetical protein
VLQENYGFSRLDAGRIKRVLLSIWRIYAVNGRSFMPLRDEFELAKLRAKNRRARFPAAVDAHYDRRLDGIIVRRNSGVELAFPPGHAQGLEHARPSQLEKLRSRLRVSAFISPEWTPTSTFLPSSRASLAPSDGWRQGWEPPEEVRRVQPRYLHRVGMVGLEAGPKNQFHHGSTERKN